MNSQDSSEQLSIHFMSFDAKSMFDKELKHRPFEWGKN